MVASSVAADGRHLVPYEAWCRMQLGCFERSASTRNQAGPDPPSAVTLLRSLVAVHGVQQPG